MDKWGCNQPQSSQSVGRDLSFQNGRFEFQYSVGQPSSGQVVSRGSHMMSLPARCLSHILGKLSAATQANVQVPLFYRQTAIRIMRPLTSVCSVKRKCLSSSALLSASLSNKNKNISFDASQLGWCTEKCTEGVREQAMPHKLSGAINSHTGFDLPERHFRYRCAFNWTTPLQELKFSALFPAAMLLSHNIPLNHLVVKSITYMQIFNFCQTIMLRFFYGMLRLTI